MTDRDDDAVSEPPLAESEGVKNQMRYALGMGRNRSGVGLAPTLYCEGVFRFRRYDPAKRDLVYRVTSSTDLADWTEVLYDSSVDHDRVPVDKLLNALWARKVMAGGSIVWRYRDRVRASQTVADDVLSAI